VAGRDITEGRAERAIAVDVGVVGDSSIWQNTAETYDIAINGMPFILATNDERRYIRQTAPFKKDQFDNGAEPGEQSLTGWWIRSQSSFHGGSGINFYDPSSGETVQHRFADSKNVDVWTKGQVTLLKSVTEEHQTTGAVVGTDHQHPNQHTRSIQWSSIEGILLHDEYDVDKIAADGTVTHFIDYNSGTSEKVYAICDDGVNAYWVTNQVHGGANKLHMYKKPLTGSSASTADETLMFRGDSIVIAYAAMEFVKDRIVLCANNKVYELTTSSTSLPSPIYTNPNTNYHYTSIAASGPAIYTAGHSAIYSTIQKYTLSTAGVMPTLTSAVVAAELPAGEIVEKLYYYLGYMMIGTNKGVRAAVVSDQDGSVNYGPLIIETSQPCYDFAGRDRFIWCATGIGALDAGLHRIDLGNEVETLRFAYAKDLQVEQSDEHYTTGVAFLGVTNRLAFCTAHETTDGAVYIESESELASTGYLTTGYIRYGTLEPKNFKRLLGRGDFSKGSLTIETVDKNGVEYDHITYTNGVPSTEVTTSQPTSAQEYVAFKFLFARDATTTSTGPIFKGYQAKATIATPRQRVMRFSVYNFDEETDRYNVVIGYSGRSFDRLSRLEDIEENGDIVTWQDLTTGELRQVVIEQITYSRLTPPDKDNSGDGGIIDITVRTV
jgi:hypothetical protein